MPDSSKAKLVAALRAMLNTMPFSAVSVCALCKTCHLNRKTFYYHYKDKYDMVCRIFEEEFLNAPSALPLGPAEQSLTALFEYLDQNRSFYVKVLRVEGQNSFREYFGKMVVDLVWNAHRSHVESDEDLAFLSHFLAGALFTSVFEWITSEAPVPPHVFTAQLKRCIENLTPARRT